LTEGEKKVSNIRHFLSLSQLPNIGN